MSETTAPIVATVVTPALPAKCTPPKDRRARDRRTSIVDRRNGTSRRDGEPMSASPTDTAAADTEAADKTMAADGRVTCKSGANVEQAAAETASPAGTGSTYDRRRGPGRRRTDYRRDAEEGHMNEEQLEFIKAMDEYKRVNCRPFPTWTEVLDLMLFLGYRKVAPVGEFKLSKGRQHPPRHRPADDDDDDSAEAESQG